MEGCDEIDWRLTLEVNVVVVSQVIPSEALHSTGCFLLGSPRVRVRDEGDSFVETVEKGSKCKGKERYPRVKRGEVVSVLLCCKQQ